MNNKIDRVKKLLKEINKLIEGLNIPSQVIEKEIKRFGNSAHIPLQKRYIGHKAIIIIKKRMEGT